MEHSLPAIHSNSGDILNHPVIDCGPSANYTWDWVVEVCALDREGDYDDAWAIFENPEAIMLTRPQRVGFLVAYFLVTGAALAAGAAALFCAHRQRGVTYRWLVGSLAASDFLNALITGGTAIGNLWTPYMNWGLGRGLCRSGLALQVVAAVANSLTLAGVAGERWRSVFRTSPAARPPRLLAHGAVIAVVWALAIAAGMPSLSYHEFITLLLLRCGDGEFQRCTRTHRCLSDDAEHNPGTYIAAVFTAIFLPLLIAFLALHAIIARFVWLRRFPPHVAPTTAVPKVPRAAETSPTLTRGKRTRNTTLTDGQTGGAESGSGSKECATRARIAPGETRPAATPQPTTNQRPAARDRHVRTFRRIVLMMAASLLLRGPSWAVSVYIFNTEAPPEDQRWLWRLKFSFSLLSVLYSALNPLLYCFPDATLGVLKWMLCCGSSRTKSASSSAPKVASPQVPPLCPELPPTRPPLPFQPRGPCGDERLTPRAGI